MSIINQKLFINNEEIYYKQSNPFKKKKSITKVLIIKFKYLKRKIKKWIYGYTYKIVKANLSKANPKSKAKLKINKLTFDGYRG